MPDLKTIFTGITILWLNVASASPGHSETALERGSYIVNSLAACAGCHTPKGSTSPTLSGGTRFGPSNASVFAANITPDRDTGLGRWSDRDITIAIREGTRPDGTRIGPPMPQLAYRAMTDADIAAIVTYLRSIPAVRHMVPRTTSVAPGSGSNFGQVPVLHPALENDLFAKGRYIANALSHCTECHTPDAEHSPDFAHHLDEGGRVFHSAEGTIIAPGITADCLKGLTDSQLAALITTCSRPDGSTLRGPMPCRAYAGMKSEDLNAVIAYLRRHSR